MSKYTLEIVSKDRKNEGEIFQSYRFDGKETIGVSKREPFAIRFRNNTWSRVQVRLSVDGTDILTGDRASTSPSGKMWLVEARSSLELNAWPEDNRGGSRFVFGDAEKGVATNTHGDTTGVGLIAAAVFTEGYTQIFSSLWNDRGPRIGTKSSDSRKFRRSRAIEYGSDIKTLNNLSFDTAAGVDSLDDIDEGPAVGAGEHVQQAISKTAGLRQPQLDEVLEVKYEWWDKLRKRLGRYRGRASDAFPGDYEEENINLRGVPRQRSKARRPTYKYL
jgi:hypothetical protein